MATTAATANHPHDIHRARFSWHFNTPGRRRWLLVQFVSAPRNLDLDDEQEVVPAAPAQEKMPSPDDLLDGYTAEIWRRRSY